MPLSFINSDLSSRHIQSAVKSIIPYQKIDCQIKCNKINEKFIKHFEGSTKTKAFTWTIIDEINNMLNRFNNEMRQDIILRI